jgi:hypothetical protein
MDSTENLTSYGIDGDRLSHAYIASGKIADSIAMAAVCSARDAAKPCKVCTHCDKASRRVHPDIIYVDKPPDKREIIVSQIRQLRKDVIVVPIESDKKVYIVNEADLMNTEAQNAFLQLLEEPPSHAVFILKTENPAAFLPTVPSRCVEIKSKPVTTPVMAESAERQANAAETANEFFGSLMRGNAQLTAFMFRLEKLDKESFSDFLASSREQALTKLRAPSPGGKAVEQAAFSRAERILARAGEMLDLNVNVGHISGFICASLLDVGSG